MAGSFGPVDGGSAVRASVILGPPLLVTVEEAAALLGLGRTRTYELVMAEKIRSVKLGRRRLVVRSSLDDFVRTLLTEQASA